MNSSRSRQKRKESKHSITQAKLPGSYELWHESVEVYVFYENNVGEGYLVPEPNRPMRIKIGLNAVWPYVVEVLIHEAMELCMHRMGMAYKRANWVTPSSGDYQFMFDHAEYTQLCGVVGRFLVSVLPELEKLYKSVRKERKAKHE